MQKMKTIVLSDGEFTVRQLDGMTGALLLPQVVALVGPAFEKMLPMLRKFMAAPDPEKVEVDIGEAIMGLTEACRAANPDLLKRVVTELLSTATVDGVELKVKLPVLFQGKPFDFYRLVWFALMLNYSRFFNDAVAQLGHLSAAKKASGSTSPTT